MQRQQDRPDATGPVYCSECANRAMPHAVIGDRMVFACEHNMIWGKRLTPAELRALREVTEIG